MKIEICSDNVEYGADSESIYDYPDNYSGYEDGYGESYAPGDGDTCGSGVGDGHADGFGFPDGCGYLRRVANMP